MNTATAVEVYELATGTVTRRDAVAGRGNRYARALQQEFTEKIDRDAYAARVIYRQG